jgi:prepilin-type N-terminal cleavage/methylation domain-containing protein
MIFKTIKNNSGFSLVELLIAVLVLLTLISAVLFASNRLLSKAEVTSATDQLNEVKKAISFYYGENKKHPKTFDDLVNSRLLPVQPDANEWEMSCANLDKLTVTKTAGDLMDEVEEKFLKICESVTKDTGTTKVSCTVVTKPYCP